VSIEQTPEWRQSRVDSVESTAILEGLLEWIEANGAAKFRAAILDVAGDLDDLKHITEPDFEELVRGMPKLKARRLRASLVELGARLA